MFEVADAFTVTGWTKLGGLVRDARLARGLSQANLAAQAGVARSWLARVEAGHRGAELEQLFRLLDALDLTLTLHASERSTDRDTKTLNRPEVPHAAGPTSSNTTRAVGPASSQGSAARRSTWGLAARKVKERESG